VRVEGDLADVVLVDETTARRHVVANPHSPKASRRTAGIPLRSAE
jgi:hypothetical protein